MLTTLDDGYSIRPLHRDDGPAMAAAYVRNRAHLAPYDPERDEEFYSLTGQVAAVTAQLEAAHRGTVDPWVLTHGTGEREVVLGRVNINNVIRGVLQSASVGYWLDHEHLGRGLATRAVEHAVRRAEELGLHRLEAGTLVHNTRSQAVLTRCGFQEYGVARRFLFIAGSWQDHVLFERILHDRPAGRQSPERRSRLRERSGHRVRR